MTLPATLHPPGWITAGRLADMPDTLVFHARDKLAETLMKGHFKLLGALAAHVAGAGWQVQAVEFSAAGQDMAVQNPRHLHIFMDDRPLYAPNALHSVPAYLRGYWYVDEVGTRNNAAPARAPYAASTIGQAEANQFITRLQARFIDKNLSKFDQAERGAVLEPGCLAFFAQDFKAPRWHRHYLSVPQMIEAAIAAKGDRVLYIKPHPNQTLDEMAHLARYHAPKAGVVVTNASIHDMLAVAEICLTVTSAVGFEALMHRKPVILGGQTDFWQQAVTLTDAAAMPQAITRALEGGWTPARFLTWYLTRMCFADRAEDLPRLLSLLQRKGYGFAPKGWF